MSAWNRFTFACLLGFACASSIAETPRTEFEQSFIGQERIPGYPLPDQCEYVGGGLIESNKEPLVRFGLDTFTCNRRQLQFLVQFITNYDKDNKVKVLDALLLPKLRKGEEYVTNGDCELNSRTDTDFIAIVLFGRREKVNWKTGVRAAWLPNPETGKIEELSTRHIVCAQPTPP